LQVQPQIFAMQLEAQGRGFEPPEELFAILNK